MDPRPRHPECPSPVRPAGWRSHVSLSALALLLACGGGQEAAPTTLPPPPPAATLKVEPLGASLPPGGTLSLSAIPSNVTGTPAITWTITETGMGSIRTATDGRSADYTAPAAAGTFHVTATISALGLSASSEVKVAAADDGGFFRIQPSPYKLQLKAGTTTRASAKGRGRKEFVPEGRWLDAVSSEPVDIPVVWSLAEGALAGTVDPATGVYTASARPGIYHLVATSIEKQRVQATIEVRVFADLPPTIAAAAPAVAVRPDMAFLEPLEQAFLRATATGTASPLVGWSLAEGVSGGTLSLPTGGPDNEVAYSASSGTGTFHAVATSTSDPSAKAEVVLQVGTRAGILILPGVSRVSPGASVDLTASVSDTALPDVVWSSSDPVGGTLAPSGATARFTAPSIPGFYYVSAQPKADLEKAALALVEVVGSATPTVKILPPPAKLQPGTRLQLQAQVLGTPNTAVTWSTTLGTVSAEGLLTVPGGTGTAVVTATSVADPARQDTVQIPVGNLPVFSTVPAVNANPSATYTYSPGTTHPDGLPATTTFVSGPDGATLTAGAVSWTPQPFQYPLENRFILKATDSQGGVSFQRWTVNFRVFGQSRSRFHNLDGSFTTVSKDYSTTLIEAIVPGPGAGFQTYPGTGTASGSFWIPGVPPGPYWLRNNTFYEWREESRIDQVDEYLGRSGGALVTQPTTATINLGGMSPWETSGSGIHSWEDPWVSWYDPNAAVFSNSGFESIDSYLLPALAPGQTAFAGIVNLAALSLKPMVSDTALGDRPMVLRYGVAAAPGGEYLSLLKEAFQAPALKMVDGAPFTLNGNFSAAFPSFPVSLSADLASFSALRTAVSPAATIYSYMISVDPEVPVAHPDQASLMGSTPPLLYAYWYQGVLPTLGTMDTGPHLVLNPLPAAFEPRGYFTATYRVPFLLPGTTTPYRPGLMLSAAAGGDGLSASIVPTHRPGALMVNGLGSQTGLSGVSTTPLLRVAADAWTARHSERRFIYIRALKVSGASTVIDGSAGGILLRFPLNQDFRVPPGILVPGKSYVIVVRLQSSNLYDRADSCSGLITP